MNEIIKNAIEVLAKKGGESSNKDEALKFTQAALNLAHAAATMAAVKKDV